jgi:hypothetical protein
MRRLLQPVAVSLALVLGSLSAFALACQWVCGHGHTAAHQHAGHHQSAAPPEPAAATQQPSRDSSGLLCPHSGLELDAVTLSSFKLFAPAAAPTTHDAVAPMAFIAGSIAASTIQRPPGGRSAPLPLRI